MTKLNKALLASTAIAFAGGLALPATAQDASEAPAVVKSGKKMKLKLYGQITRHFGFVSDGENNQFRQGQNPNTSTRMGIDGRGKINKDWSLRTRFEFQIVGDSGLAVDADQDGDRERFRIRHADAIFANKRLGSIWIGRGDTATNGTEEVTLAPGIGTGHLGGSLHQGAQGVGVLDENTGASLGEVGDWFKSQDGAGRMSRMRYDTPSFQGLKASVDYIDDGSWSAALRYKGSAGGAKIAGAVGYTAIRADGKFGDTKGDFDRIDGSISVKLPMGLGATVAGGHDKRNETGEQNGWSINPSIWYTMKATELGPTTFEYALQVTEDLDTLNDEGIAHGVTIAQVLANTGTDTYLAFRYYTMDRDGTSPDDVWTATAGFRARF